MNAWDLPASKNPLKTREDLELCLAELLEPLKGRFVRSGAGLHVGNSSAHYDEVAALLEGECRLLWGLAPLAAGGGSSPFFAKMREGIAAGVDPGSPGYWGVGGDRDQRFVEMCPIAFALLLAPGEFWEPLSEVTKDRLAAWLSTINQVELPPTNWEFFRVMVNLALRRLGRAYDLAALERGFAAIEALYRSDGWYQDETNYDLYNPFAFHYYGLFYAALFGEEDPDRSARYRERARLFAAQYLPWFGSDGSQVPFGRSLCYRFAASSFFSALAFAGEDSLGWGELKGIVLRNLRWWLSQPILDHEGLLTIGYAYPNLHMAEQYNSPGSPYWSFKIFLLLALPPEHPFWQAEEKPLPEQPAISLNAPPRLLACRTGKGDSEQVYLLNAGQYPCWESANSAAKYAKFAYSSSFGFCASQASFDLSKTGCDSSLLLSEGDGYWRERRASEGRYACEDYVYSRWSPWPDVSIDSWILPFGPWHLRVHAIRSGRNLIAVEGGFSLPDRSNLRLPRKPLIEAESEGSLLASFPWASGGIVELLASGGAEERKAELHKPEPNLNLLFPKVLVPTLRGGIGTGPSVIAAAVYANPGPGRDGWGEKPLFAYDPASGLVSVSRTGRSVRFSISAPPAL